MHFKTVHPVSAQNKSLISDTEGLSPKIAFCRSQYSALPSCTGQVKFEVRQGKSGHVRFQVNVYLFAIKYLI